MRTNGPPRSTSAFLPRPAGQAGIWSLVVLLCVAWASPCLAAPGSAGTASEPSPTPSPALLQGAELATAWGSAEGGAAPVGSELTLPQALRLGRLHSPKQALAAANLAVAAARVQQSRAALLPQASAQVQVQRLTSNYVLRPGSLPANLMPSVSRAKNRSYNFFAGQAQISQLVYDFGNSWHAYRAGQAGQKAQDYNVRLSELNLEYELRSAYYAAHAAQGQVAAGRETLANMQQHLQQIRQGVAVGTQAAIDVVTAESNVASAKVTLLGYENSLISSKIALNGAMGHEGDVHYTLAPPPWPQPDLLGVQVPGAAAHGPSPATDSPVPAAQANIDAGAGAAHAASAGSGGGAQQASSWQLSAAQEALLVERSMQLRPDLALIAWQRRAQAHKVQSLAGQRLPSIGVQGTLSEQGGELKALAYNWSAMGTVSWQASTGGLLHGQLQEARATLRSMDAMVRSIRLSVRAGLQNAVLNLATTSAARDAAKVGSQSAAERLRLAESRFAAGVGNIIELSDAQLAKANATSQVVQSDYDYLCATAQWQLAMGELADADG